MTRRTQPGPTDMGIVLEDQEEVRCLLHACEAYSQTRRDLDKPTSRIDGIADAVRALLSPESRELERQRDEQKKTIKKALIDFAKHVPK